MFSWNIKPDFLLYIKNLKDKYNFKIIDTHVHPFDVMGISHYSDYKIVNNNVLNYIDNKNNFNNNYLKPELLEILKFNFFSNFLSKESFKFLPNVINKNIKILYNKVGTERALEEMNKVFIDEVVFLPVEPWTTTDLCGKYYQNKKFYLLASLDVYKIKINEIRNLIERYINDFNIIGIKLHPNLQNFKPRPCDNSKEIAEKLEEIYSLAEKNNLYLIFHAGISFFTKNQDKKYANFKRSEDSAILENFCDLDGKSEIFDRKIPIILAHLGHFGLNKINYKLVKNIVKKYDNIYFDTAGSSPKLIQKFIELVGSERIILGSDAFYNRMIFAVYFVFLGAQKSKTKENLDDIIINILGKNFYSKIIKK